MDILSSLGTLMTDAGEIIVNGFEAVVPIFYDVAGTPAGPTFVGWLILSGLAILIVKYGITFILRLFKALR